MSAVQPSVLGCAQEALKPVNSAARDVVAQLQRLLGQQPDLSFPITAAKAQTWLINTFLDEARPACVRVAMIRVCYRSCTSMSLPGTPCWSRRAQQSTVLQEVHVLLRLCSPCMPTCMCR